MEASAYEQVEQLGQGSFGEVFKVRRVADGKDLTMKVQLCHDVATLSSLMHEAVSMGGDHLVRCVDCFVEEVPTPPRFKHFTVMECYDCSLAEYVRTKGPLGRGGVILLLVHVGRALADLHKRNKVHGDIKPMNIFCRLVAGGGGVAAFYVGDLGTAKEVVDPQQMSFKGSLMYIPPEQRTGQPCGLPVDLYSLGVTAVEAGVSLERVRELVAATHQEFDHSAVLQEAGAVLTERLGADVTRVVIRLLAERSEERPTARQLLDDLRGLEGPAAAGELDDGASLRAEVQKLRVALGEKEEALDEAESKVEELLEATRTYGRFSQVTGCPECNDTWAVCRKYECSALDVKRWKGRKGTPLHVAAEQGKKELLEHLLRYHGGQEWVNYTDGNMGETALSVALAKGRISIIRSLLAAGADPSVNDDEAQLQEVLAEVHQQMQ